jgi:preprotein translocase subunit SecD
MGKNLTQKTGFIIAVLVIFIYGIFGIPHGGLKQSIANRINLGLDLKGGTHLVLKVHTIEAVNSTTDRDVAALNTALASFGAHAVKLDPTAHPEVITITGGTANQASDIRGVLTGNEYAAYDLNSSNGTSTLTMKASAVSDSNAHTVDVSMEAIRQRIDSMGVSEPVIEKYGLGADQILVELPGVTDLAKVEGIIQSTAKLEIHEFVGTAYDTEADAFTAIGGAVPPD